MALVALNTSISWITGTAPYATNYQALAIDGSTTTRYYSGTNGNATAFLTVKLKKSYKVTKLSIYGKSTRCPKTFTLLGSSTGAFAGEETTLLSVADAGAWDVAGEYKDWTFANSAGFDHYKLDITDTSESSIYVGVYEFILYAGDTEVPEVGSDLTGGETATASSIYSASYPASYSIDDNAGTYWRGASGQEAYWLQIQFAAAKIINQFTYTGYVGDYTPSAFTVLASNTGAFSGEEVTLATRTGVPACTGEKRYEYFNNSTAYSYYRINATTWNNPPRLYEVELAQGLTVIISANDAVTTAESANIELPGGVVDLSINIYDSVVGTDICALSVSDSEVSIIDTISVSESVGCELGEVDVADVIISVSESIEFTESAISEVSDLGAEAVETVSVQEDIVAAASDLVLSVVESSSLSESTISTVSDPLIEVVDDVTVGEEASVSTDEAVLDEEINVQDSVSLAESTGAEVSDLPGSVLDTVTLDEQVAAAMLLQVEAVDDVSVDTAIDFASPVLEPNIYDAVGVDENIVVDSVLEAVVEDIIGVAEDVAVSQEAVATRSISVSDTVLISELTAGLAGDLFASTFDSVVVSPAVSMFWVIASGVLILDVDIIVPLVDYEMLVPSVDTYIQLPTIDLEVG